MGKWKIKEGFAWGKSIYLMQNSQLFPQVEGKKEEGYEVKENLLSQTASWK